MNASGYGRSSSTWGAENDEVTKWRFCVVEHSSKQVDALNFFGVPWQHRSTPSASQRGPRCYRKTQNSVCFSYLSLPLTCAIRLNMRTASPGYCRVLLRALPCRQGQPICCSGQLNQLNQKMSTGNIATSCCDYSYERHDAYFCQFLLYLFRVLALRTHFLVVFLTPRLLSWKGLGCARI